jgi:hypothetical protein
MQSFAEECCKWAREGLTHLKQEGMNKKRQQKSTTAERKFCTYTEEDIKHAPDIKSIGPQLSRDKPAGRTSPEQVAHDKMVAGTLGHNNFRADPELQKEGRPRVIAVCRIACLCAGCKWHMQLPLHGSRPPPGFSGPSLPGRYDPHNDCELAPVFGRLNDWKLCTLEPGSEAAAAEMEEDDDVQLQVWRGGGGGRAGWGEIV